jgi:RNA polymerase sigma-70 factor, ECF subfamily
MDGRFVLVRHMCDACHATGVRCQRQSDPNAESGSHIDVSAHTDADLVADATGGDVEAFAELSRRYRNAYTRFAVRMVGDRDDAEDALQSAFIRAYRALDQCREPDRFGAWLYQIVVNECRTFVARRARRERKVMRDELRLNEAAVRPTVDAQDTIEDVQYALAQLDADQREAFILKHVELLSYEEMAEITGTGISALKMRVKRACSRLRELLEEVHDV